MPERGLGLRILGLSRRSIHLGRWALRRGASRLRVRCASLGLLLGHLVVHPGLLPAVRGVRHVRVPSAVALVPAVPTSVLPHRSTDSGVSRRPGSPHGRSPRSGISRARHHTRASASDDGHRHAAFERNGIFFAWATRDGDPPNRSGSPIAAWRRHRDRASIQAANPRRYIDLGSVSWILREAFRDTTVAKRLRMVAERRLIVWSVAGLGRRSQSLHALERLEQQRLFERSARRIRRKAQVRPARRTSRVAFGAAFATP